MYRQKVLHIIIISFILITVVVNFNFSKDMSATASTGESGELGADMAVDGDMGTRWSSEFLDNQWLIVDIGEMVNLIGIKISWENAYTSEYKILVSEDNNTWTDAYETTDGGGGTEDITFDSPQVAQYIKLLLIKRGTEWGNSIYEIKLKKGEGKAVSKKTANIKASAIQDDRYLAAFAYDNKMETRWSSPFTDPNWLMIDLEQEEEIGGLVVYWDDAYASAYDILLSSNELDWRKVFYTDKGDGKSDEIFFKKQKARYIKIYGRERATAGGYSILEVKIIKSDEVPIITVSSNKRKANNVFDGDLDTRWTSEKKSGDVIIDFRENRGLGGIIIHYKDGSLIEKRNILISDDKTEWESVFSSKKKGKNTDRIYLDVMSTRYIKISASCKNQSLSIKDITIKGIDEKITNKKVYEIAALQSPKGFYPLWINNKQEYWTAVGVIDDNIESLVSENGVVEPWHYSYTFAPIIRVGNKIFTYEDVKTIQSLEDDYLPLPSVVWKSKKFDLVIDVFAGDKSKKSSTYLKYSIINKSSETFKGEFYLLIRPFQLNPPWMHGGTAYIKSINYNYKKTGMMEINNKEALFIPQSPDQYGTSEYKNLIGYGDIIDDIYGGTFSGDNKNFEDETGYGSAALKYNLVIKPGATKSLYFIAPLHDKKNEIDKDLNKSNISEHFNKKREITKKIWEDKLDNIKIELPDKEFSNTLKSNVAYILINDDTLRLQPGSRNYESSWIRGGTATSTALLSMGYNKEVKGYLNWITEFIKSDGWVPFIINNQDEIVTHGWNEYDSQGQYIHSILQYYLFTKDKEFLSDKKQKIIDNVNFIQALRMERKKDEYRAFEVRHFYGILPESASHEGYKDVPCHSYWDDFWALRGINDAAQIFKILNDSSHAGLANNIKKDFEKCLYGSLDMVMEKRGIKYVPGSADLGDFDPASTAIAIWPCNEMNNLPKKSKLETFNKYWDEFKKRSNDDWVGGFSSHELRIANAFILLNQRNKLYKMISKFFEWKHPRAWNHWAETITSDYRMPQYVGDMPHAWIGAEYINVIRNMLILEDGNKLYLGKGIPYEWVAEGKNIVIKDMPTYFGKISYSTTSNKNTI